MSEEELNEAIEYNLEYLDAMLSEEIFGGDYTSSIESKYANKEIDRLQQRIDKAVEYIENHSLYETEYDYDYEENSYLSGIDDETAKKDLLEILKGDNND